MLTTVKGLPLAYNKDLQEDKEGLFDAIDTIKFSLAVYAQLIRGMKVRKDVMLKAVREDFSNATDLADYLVKKVCRLEKLIVYLVMLFITALKITNGLKI